MAVFALKETVSAILKGKTSLTSELVAKIENTLSIQLPHIDKDNALKTVQTDRYKFKYKAREQEKISRDNSITQKVELSHIVFPLIKLGSGYGHKGYSV